MKKNILLSIFILLIWAFSCKTRPQGEAIQVLRMPYLQSAIRDSICILWRTNKGQSCQVAYKTEESMEWTRANGSSRTTNTGWIENKVILKDLQPETRYAYRIYTDKTALIVEKDLHFVSPIAGEDSVFSFFAVGDIGEPVENEGTPDLLGKALGNYVDSLRFGLLLGDIIYPDGKSEDYDKNLFQHFGNVFPYIPVFPVLGNHDWHEPEKNYMEEWELPGNEHYYSFDYGNVHFVGLDTKNGEMYEYEKQVAWLEKDLSGVSPSQDWKVVFLHHNGKSCTYKHDYEGVVSLYPIFERLGVDLVLNGHAHTYERLKPMNGEGEPAQEEASKGKSKGFVSITVGSGGKLRGIGSDPKAWTPDPDSCKYPGLVAAYVHDWAFLALEIRGRQLSGRAIATESLKVVDQFVIDKR